MRKGARFEVAAEGSLRWGLHEVELKVDVGFYIGIRLWASLQTYVRLSIHIDRSSHRFDVALVYGTTRLFEDGMEASKRAAHLVEFRPLDIVYRPIYIATINNFETYLRYMISSHIGRSWFLSSFSEEFVRFLGRYSLCHKNLGAVPYKVDAGCLYPWCTFCRR